MLLEEAQSREEVEAALAAGDEELEEDIEDRLSEARRRWENSGYAAEYVELDEDTVLDIIHHSPDFLAELQEAVPCQAVPREVLQLQLLYIARRDRREGRRRDRFGPFELNSDRGRAAFSYRIAREISYFFDFDTIEHVEKIPVERLEAFLKELGYGMEWEITDTYGDGAPRTASAYVEGDPSYLYADEDGLEEWCRDALSDHMDKWVRTNPVEALEAFLKELSPSTATALREIASPNDEDLMDMVHRFFTVPAEQASIEEEIGELAAPLRVDTPPVAQDTILEVSRDDLLRWGVTRGVMWEMAPWRLIRLTPADLRSEGRRMRHCVGDLSMKYLQALAANELEIWSLRDRADKPRFTLEVDPRFWERHGLVLDSRGEDMAVPMHPAWRAEWIYQLKGKANRRPGYAQSGDTGPFRFPEEVVFWQHVLRELGADPAKVGDLPFMPDGGVLPNRSFDRPWSRRR